VPQAIPADATYLSQLADEIDTEFVPDFSFRDLGHFNGNNLYEHDLAFEPLAASTPYIARSGTQVNNPDIEELLDDLSIATVIHPPSKSTLGLPTISQ